MRPVEEVLGEMSNHASFGWTTRLISLLSQTWAKLNYEVSLRSSLVSPNSSHFRNSLLKMINLQQKFSTHFKRVATNTVVPDQLNPTTTHRSLSTLMLRSNTSAFIMGELNIWSMFGIVVGAVTFLIGFYYVANCIIQRRVEERNAIRSIEEIPLVPPGSAQRRSRSTNNF